MDKITFGNKVDTKVTSVAEINKVTGANLNEIKNVTNLAVDQLELNTPQIASNKEDITSIINGSGKTYISVSNAMAASPLPSDNTPFTVRDSVGNLEDGFYIYLSTEVGGYKFLKTLEALANGYYVVNSLLDFDSLISSASPGVWMVISDITLDANKTIPTGVTLQFRNAKINLGGFILTGTNTKINAGLNQIFDTNGSLSGFEVVEAYPQWFGALGDGIADDKTAIQSTINSFSHVVLKSNFVFVIGDGVTNNTKLELHSNSIFEVNGDLLLAPNTPDDAAMIVNSDRVAYQNNINIIGSGRILGNKANQSDIVEIRHVCIDLYKVISCKVTVAEVGSNKWDNAYQTTPPSGQSAALSITDCKWCIIEGVLLYQWEHEGIGIDPMGGICYENTVTNCICSGSGAKSFSGIQVGGVGGTSYGNIISNCTVSDCGASGIGMDSTHSTITGCTVRRNGYFHGINLGHASAVSDFIVVSNCTLENIGNLATTQDSNGINIGNGTSDVAISNCTIDGVKNSGINLSVADNCNISNVKVNNAQDHGFKLNVSNGTKIKNCIVKNQGSLLLSDVGTPSENLWYEINETVFRRYGTINGEGSWTPVLEGTSGSATQNIQIGFYERNGRVINFRARLSISNKSTIAGTLIISGLPFTSSSSASNLSSISVGAANGFNILSGETITGLVEGNSNIIKLQIWDNADGTSLLETVQIDNNMQIFISGAYMV